MLNQDLSAVVDAKSDASSSFRIATCDVADDRLDVALGFLGPDYFPVHCISAANRSARPLPRGFTGHVARPGCSIQRVGLLTALFLNLANPIWVAPQMAFDA
jgi:hypothetical protein